MSDRERMEWTAIEQLENERQDIAGEGERAAQSMAVGSHDITGSPKGEQERE
jgi:hypothetical protein